MHICLEALIRLFLEVLRSLFGDITLLWKGGYLSSELPTLISTLKWIFFFTVVAMLTKSRIFRTMIIVGVPSFVNLIIDKLNLIPHIGSIISFIGGIALAPITALAWAYALLIDEEINPFLRIAATPGIMILAAINTIHPLTILGDISFILASGFIPQIIAFTTIGLIGLIIFLSPSFLCIVINKVLKLWSSWRYSTILILSPTLVSLIREKIYKILRKIST